MTARVDINVRRRADGWHEYVVTTPTGYRAVIPKCGRDECAAGTIAECRRKLDHRHQHKVNGSTSVNVWCRHTRTHCHGWHDGRVADFAKAVSRSYGSARRDDMR